MNIRRFKLEDEEKLRVLFTQLTKEKILLEGKSIIKDERCFCYVVEENGQLLGTGTLSIFQVPVRGFVGMIQNVVVDEESRGKGLGRLIVDKLIEIAQENNLKNVTLISNPDRVAARELYKSMGFELVNTGFFKKKL